MTPRALGPRVRGRGHMLGDALAQARRGVRPEVERHRPPHGRGARTPAAPARGSRKTRPRLGDGHHDLPREVARGGREAEHSAFGINLGVTRHRADIEAAEGDRPRLERQRAERAPDAGVEGDVLQLHDGDGLGDRCLGYGLLAKHNDIINSEWSSVRAADCNNELLVAWVVIHAGNHEVVARITIHRVY